MEELAAEFSSTSRQKSCHACVKGKRGCDKQYPVCSRCNDKKIPCIYAKRTYAEAFYDFDSVELDMSWEGFNALSTPAEYVDDNLTTSATPTLDHPTGLATLEVPVISSSEFPQTPDISLGTMELTKNAGEPLGHQEEEQALNMFDYSLMADLCKQFEPWHIYDSTTKVHFLVQSIKSYPSTFAKDNHTPWMHRYLYKDEMPSSLRSSFATSSLYSNMTSSNKASVLRVFCQSLAELKGQQLANTPREKLARAQALFLYQIIGLFDGDVALRSNADRTMPLLLDWLDDLCTIRENLRLPNNMNNKSPPRSWEWWIFSESVRRTVVMAYAFLSMWSLMSQNNNSIYFDAWKYIHYWSMSRPLWEASSSFDFFQIWKPHHVVGNFDFDSFVETGSPDDVDDFSKVLMVTYMGLDGTKQWFLDRGYVF